MNNSINVNFFLHIAEVQFFQGIMRLAAVSLVFASFQLLMLAEFVSTGKYSFLVETDKAVAELNNFWASTGLW